ncbi:MAG: tetratricopeptide repeat protein [Myxococcota bacterium]
MNEQVLARAEIERLERIVAGDPAAPVVPALAEAHRRGGDPKRAESLARAGLAERPESVAARVALGLALLDQGRTADARDELEGALEATPDHVRCRQALAELGPLDAETAVPGGFDSELDAAFEQARPDRDAMVDANDLAQEAVRRVDSTDSPFATETVADLLEQQGDLEGAAAVRRRLGDSDGSRAETRARVATTLERWLSRLRRSAAR